MYHHQQHVERLPKRTDDKRQPRRRQPEGHAVGYDEDHHYVGGVAEAAAVAAAAATTTDDDIGVYGDDDSLTATDSVSRPTKQAKNNRLHQEQHHHQPKANTSTTPSSSDSTSEIGIAQLFRTSASNRKARPQGTYRAIHIPSTSGVGDYIHNHRPQRLTSSSSDTDLNKTSLASILGRGSPITYKSYYSSQVQNFRKRRSLWGRSISSSSIFAFYAKRYARDKFHLALKSFRTWYHKQITYHHLSKRMEFNQKSFEQWFRSKGQPLSLRALDHFDQVVIWIAGE